jgi:hypothetical protein
MIALTRGFKNPCLKSWDDVYGLQMWDDAHSEDEEDQRLPPNLERKFDEETR